MQEGGKFLVSSCVLKTSLVPVKASGFLTSPNLPRAQSKNKEQTNKTEPQISPTRSMVSTRRGSPTRSRRNSSSIPDVGEMGQELTTPREAPEKSKPAHSPEMRTPSILTKESKSLGNSQPLTWDLPRKESILETLNGTGIC